MLGLPLAFAQPLVLLGLLTLPVLWWLLRLVPPRPRRVNFPPTRLLFEIAPKEETPARTPWWLTLLRLALAALLILAAAGPIWNPQSTAGAGSRPLLILFDDGWPAAAAWDARIRSADDIVARAESEGRGVALLPLSEPARDLSLETAGAVRVRLQQLKPKPHSVQRAEALPAVARFLGATPEIETVWLSDGVDIGEAKTFVDGLARALNGRALTVIDGGLPPAQGLAAAENSAAALSVKVVRAAAGDGQGVVRALDRKGLPLGDARFAFRSGERETEAVLDMPVEIRNDVARLEIVSERSAGAVQLLDKRWRRRSVGVVSGSTVDTAQPLLASTYYLSRALSPFADVRLAEPVAPAEAIKRFLEQNLPIIVLADVGNVAGDAHQRLSRWIEDGGVLVRFAGPRLAAAGEEALVPVRLRQGGRTLGGSLTWEQPQHLASFGRDSPFAGMPIANDVTVTRQVLAEPDSALADRSWAMLADGTPLVTAAPRGKGMIVLFHVTADTRWSDLPLSGTFVEMLKRIVGLAGTGGTGEANAAETRDVATPTRVLDGFGAFTTPPATARPVPVRYAGRATADNPPGFYGPAEALVAVNTLAPADRPQPLDVSPLSARVEAYHVGEPHDLRGPTFLAALLLLLADALVVFWLSGGWSRMIGPRRAATAASVGLALILAAVASPLPGHAQTRPAQSAGAPPRSALETKLAYVVTGDAQVDSISKVGLAGLTLFLAQRTALEAGEPIGIEPAKDELAFYPLIYWPVLPNSEKPSADALARIDTYMKQGGTVLFDTRDAIDARPGDEMRSPAMLALRNILSGLDIPALEPIPREHVLTKTFFLLHDFPGRYANGQLWVEALPSEEDPDERERRPARAGDGVSSILITSNDLAGAWAMRPDGQPMLPLTPGEPRQREFAFRAGVNIVMYTLTGNYKADQVHVPALLERLGQ